MRRGHAVHRINLNGGDEATWPDGVRFAGRAVEWPAHVADVLDHRAISDLVLFGDNRPLHAAAIRCAVARGIGVHVFEEGYLRPDWVTLEAEGVNGHSRLPRDPEAYRAAAAQLPPLPTYEPLPSYAQARSWGAFYYHAQVVLRHWRFPFYRSHRTRNPVHEGLAYFRRFQRHRTDARRTARGLGRLRDARYFLFPLQLDADYQVRIHSPFGGLKEAIDFVLADFAAHAPADTLLVLKEHPLDSGFVDWHRHCAVRAREYGLDQRVVFLPGGDLTDLIEGAAGVVTINSTSGTLALTAGKPVKVLGTSIYNLADVTDQQPLDLFWSDPRAPDAATYDAFCRVLGDRCLLHGAFLSVEGREDLIGQAIRRLEQGMQSDGGRRVAS